jgi:dihydroflavonol-4-reductase
MVTALVTGATGCVGANLIDSLHRHGWRAVALRRTTSSLRALKDLTFDSAIGDVLDRPSLVKAMRGVDVVFHAAAVADYWRTGKERLYQVNVEGTRKVLAAAKSAGVGRVVVTSSVAAVGQPAFGQLADETCPFSLPPAQFHYGYSKWLAEQVAQEAVASGQDVVIVNPAVVIGPRDVNLISGSLILEEKRFGIPVYPLGGVCLIDAADVCDAMIATAERGRKGERYILGGENLWYRQMLSITAQVVGRRPPFIPLPRGLTLLLAAGVDLLRRAGAAIPANGDQLRFSTRTLWFDSSKARRELGLNTRPYSEAARRAYEWYNENGYVVPALRTQ